MITGRYILVATLAWVLAALLFVYLFMPALWLSIMSVDESLDAHEAGLALVASRTSLSVSPYRPRLTDTLRQPLPRNRSSSQHGEAYLAAAQSSSYPLGT